MKHLLVIIITLIIAACGLEDLDSVSKFIGKTQEDPNLYPSDGKHIPGGAHASAYLINKVHENDNDDENCGEDRLGTTCNLTVDIDVGWWSVDTASCSDCSGKRSGSVKPGVPPPTVEGTDKTGTSCDCGYRMCLRDAPSEVNKAINVWLAPLRTPYNRTDDPIVSGDYTTGGKVHADLTIKFFCSASVLGSPSDQDLPSEHDCGTGNVGSCTRYKDSVFMETPEDRGAVSPVDPPAGEEPSQYNQPIIYIGSDGRDFSDPSKVKGYDEIGEHDRLDLFHEIGHAFGLADTHNKDDKTQKIGKQPHSIMARDRIFVRGNTDLVLSNDDKAGVQWLYEHHRRGNSTRNCRFQNEYTYQDYPTGTPEEGCEPSFSLITALKNRNAALAISTIDTDPHLNINAVETGTGYSALHYAIIQYDSPDNSPTDTADYLTIIQEIINYSGVNLNIKDNLGRTPLYLAVQLDQQQVVTLLLSSPGIRVQEADDNSNTPLHSAAALGYAHLVSTMQASFSTYVDLKNNTGRTAMHLAAANGHTDTVRAFSTYPGGIGSLAGAKDNDGNTALHLAAENGRDAVVEVILQDAVTLLNDANNHQETPLHLAAKLGRTTTVTSLLQQTGIEVNTQDDQGNTPLHLAVIHNSPDIVRLLLNKAGIDTTITNNNNKTARDEAVSRRYTDIVEVFDGGETLYGTSSAQRLIQALKVGNVDPDEYCDTDDSEESEACRRNSALAIIRTDQDLDVNYVEDDTGNTALHYAVLGDDPTSDSRGPYETAVDLLTRRTLLDPNITNENGSAPLHLAVQYDKVEVVRLLLRHRNLDVNLTNNIGETALHIAVDLAHEDIVQELLNYRTDNVAVNLQDDQGHAPIHIAAEQSDTTIIRILLDDRRIDVNLRTRTTRETALHIAAEYDNDDIVRELLSNGDIDVNSQDATGSTALHIAAHHGSERVVTELLNDTNIDLTILDNQDLSAYGRAEANGRKHITAIFDSQNKGDDIIFRGTLMEELRDKKQSEDKEQTALDIIAEDEDLDVNEKDSSSGNTPMHYAITYEYQSLIDALLQHDELEINSKNNRGETPLLLAIKLEQENTANKLLGNDSIDVNLADSSGATPLLLAAKNEQENIAALILLRSDVKVNSKDKSSTAALHIVIDNGNLDILKALLRYAGIDPNIKNNRGATPLHLATEVNRVDAVRELLNNDNTDVNLKNGDDLTALQIAIDDNHREIIDMLLELSTTNVNLKNRHGETLLLVAVKDEKNNLTQKLLAHPTVDVNAGNSKQKTPLMFAAERNSAAIVTTLLAHNDIKVNAQDDKKFTALHFAAHKGHVNAAKQLLEHNDIDITLKDGWGLTAHKRAAVRKHPDIVALFEQRDAGNLGSVKTLLVELARHDSEDIIMNIINTNVGSIAINAVDANNGYTALHYAAELNYSQVVTALLAYPYIQVNFADEQSNRPLHLAARKGHNSIVQALLGHKDIQVNARDNGKATPLHRAAAGGHYNTVMTLLAAATIKPALTAGSGHTALHWAAQLGHHLIVGALLNKEVNLINMKTDSGGSAIYYAAWFGHQSVVQELLRYNSINLNLRDTEGDTALHKAAEYNRLAIARLLLENFASVQITNKSGKKARDIAEEKGYTDMAQLIDNY